jgi:hypothetical protein
MGEAILELSLLAFEFIAWVIDMARRPARLSAPNSRRPDAEPGPTCQVSVPPPRSAR